MFDAKKNLKLIMEIKMDVWKSYYKTAKQTMREYNPGENLTGISVAPGETPKIGGKIAADNQGSQWYISPEFITGNYTLAGNYEPMECQIFVNHILRHLKKGQAVECKICKKSIFEILKDEAKHPQRGSRGLVR